MYIYIYIHICKYIYIYIFPLPPHPPPSPPHGRFPKFHRVLLGRDPGTLKSDIVSKKVQLICSDLRLSN